eukprot:UC1_evm4s740
MRRSQSYGGSTIAFRGGNGSKNYKARAVAGGGGGGGGEGGYSYGSGNGSTTLGTLKLPSINTGTSYRLTAETVAASEARARKVRNQRAFDAWLVAKKEQTKARRKQERERNKRLLQARSLPALAPIVNKPAPAVSLTADECRALLTARSEIRREASEDAFDDWADRKANEATRVRARERKLRREAEQAKQRINADTSDKAAEKKEKRRELMMHSDIAEWVEEQKSAGLHVRLPGKDKKENWRYVQKMRADVKHVALTTELIQLRKDLSNFNV